MSAKIADFTDADRWVAETARKERYGERVAIEPADKKDRAGAASGKTGTDLKKP